MNVDEARELCELVRKLLELRVAALSWKQRVVDCESAIAFEVKRLLQPSDHDCWRLVIDGYLAVVCGNRVTLTPIDVLPDRLLVPKVELSDSTCVSAVES